MPRSKSRRKRKKSDTRAAAGGGAKSDSIAWGASAGAGKATAAAARRKPVPWKLILGAVAVIAVAAAAWAWWDTRQAAEGFEELAARGAAALDNVETLPDQGGGHVPQGQAVPYPTDPPTSGPHWPTPTSAGLYRDRQWPEALVHALEHGNIVIYYDAPGEEVIETIRGWAGLYGGAWDGVVATPKTGLESEIVLTAWRRVLRLDPFDAAGAAAFVDRYRGRGPENRVR